MAIDNKEQTNFAGYNFPDHTKHQSSTAVIHDYFRCGYTGIKKRL